MATKANYFKLGAFVAGALAVLLGLLITLGGGRWFRDTIRLETYFNESVQGLDIGSKVRYRGVVLGEVSKISFTYTKYELDKPMAERKQYVLVEAAIRPELVGVFDPWDDARRQREIEKGLRVRIAPLGITGTNYIEVDYVDPKSSAPLPISWTPYDFYIPSTPSVVKQFVSAAGDVIERVQRLELEATLGNLNKLLVAMNGKVDQLDTKGLSDGARRAIDRVQALPVEKLGRETSALAAELRESNKRLRQIIGNPLWDRIPEDAAATLAKLGALADSGELQASLGHVQRTLQRVDRLLAGREEEIGATLDNLRQISDNLRDLTETARRHPSSLLFGAPPRPAEGARQP